MSRIYFRFRSILLAPLSSFASSLVGRRRRQSLSLAKSEADEDRGRDEPDGRLKGLAEGD